MALATVGLAVNLNRGKPLAVLGPLFGLFSIVGAVRLAKPGSSWFESYGFAGIHRSQAIE